jgi:hypothetical protein
MTTTTDRSRKQSKKERKAKNKEKQVRRNVSGPMAETVLAPDGSRPTVMVKSWSMRGMPHELTVAGNRWLRDYETAHSSGLGCRGFEPGVDGGGMSQSAPTKRLAAVQRLGDVAREIGPEDYKILLVMVRDGRGPEELHKAGGPKIDVITNVLKRILRRVAGYYSGKPLGPDSLLRAADKIIAAMERDNTAEGNVLLRNLIAKAA